MLLSERVKAVTGPDRGVDHEIWLSVTFPEHPIELAIKSSGSFWGRTPIGAASIDKVFYRGPAYTRSIDAAMTLYESLPDTIPSCPIKASAVALKARGL